MKTDSTYSNHPMSIEYKHTQLESVYRYLQTHMATASMLSIATGVPHKNICRYKRELEKKGKLIQFSKSTCKITGFKAWYLTTNQEMMVQSIQLSLFDTINLLAEARG